MTTNTRVPPRAATPEQQIDALVHNERTRSRQQIPEALPADADNAAVCAKLNEILGYLNRIK